MNFVHIAVYLFFGEKIKNRRNKTIIAVCSIIALLIIVAGFVYYYKYNNVNNNSIESTNVDTKQNYIIKDSANNEINEQNNINQQSSENINKDQQNITIENKETIDDYINDSSWAKENLYIKTDCMGKETDLSIRQSIHNSTIQIGSKNVNIVIVTYNSRDGRTSNQCNLVKMSNKNITVIPLENATEDTYILNSTQKVIIVDEMAKDGERGTVYSITENGFKKLTHIESQVTITEDNIIKEYYYQDEQEITEEKFHELYNKYFKN